MVPRIEAGAMVQVCVAITVAAAPSQRATVTLALPLVESTRRCHVAGSKWNAAFGDGAAAYDSSSKVGAATWTKTTSLAVPPFHMRGGAARPRGNTVPS